jgi:prophage antirepressor-like protein
MSADLRPFLFESERLVRTWTDENGDPWFVAADVCAALGVGNPRDALARLDEDEKGVVSTDTPGGVQTVNTVNEPGLYRLVFTSRKPVAERFKRWLAHEVLPAIRRTGRYAPESEPVSDPADQRLHLRLRQVELALRVHGEKAAHQMWIMLDLPVVPAMVSDPESYGWEATADGWQKRLR